MVSEAVTAMNHALKLSRLYKLCSEDSSVPDKGEHDSFETTARENHPTESISGVKDTDSPHFKGPMFKS
jgi:hypothetical protein